MTVKRTVRSAGVVALATVAAVLHAVPASACSCAFPQAACTQYFRVAGVFAGTVIDIQPTADSPYIKTVRFAVDRRGRGIDTDTVEMVVPEQTGVNCGFTFLRGQRYIVYAHSDAGGGLTTSMCSGTKRAIDAPADLAFLHHVTTNPGGVRVFGQVRRVEDDLVSFGRADFGGIPGARVQLSDGTVSHETVTDRDGRYEFRDLTSGTYTPAVTLPTGLGFAGPPLPATEHHPPPRSISLVNPSECAVASFWARTDAQITGAVLAPDGRPAADESIDLIATVNVNSRDQRIPHVTVRTGADGRFTFAYVPAGTYVVGINLGRSPLETELDRRAYHPGTTDPARATHVTIQPGSRVRLEPLTLPEWARERQVSGRVVWEDGRPAPEATVTMAGAMLETLPLGPCRSIEPPGAPCGTSRPTPHTSMPPSTIAVCSVRRIDAPRGPNSQNFHCLSTI